MFTNKDERVTATLQRLYTAGFWLILTVAVIYVVLMSAMLKAPYHEYAFAIYLLAGIILYIAVAPILVGIIEKETMSIKTGLLSSSICGLIVGIIVTINNLANYASHYKNEQVFMLIPIFIISALSAMVITMMIIVPILLLNNWRQNEIERNLDDSEF